MPVVGGSSRKNKSSSTKSSVATKPITYSEVLSTATKELPQDEKGTPHKQTADVQTRSFDFSLQYKDKEPLLGDAHTCSKEANLRQLEQVIRLIQEIEQLTSGHSDIASASAKLRSFIAMVSESVHCDYAPPLHSVYSVINKFNDYLKRNDVLRSLASSSQTLQTIHPAYHQTFENIRQWSEDGDEADEHGDIIAEREAHAVRRLADLQKMVKHLACLQRPAAELQEALEVRLEEIKGESISTLSEFIDSAGNKLLSINSDIAVVRQQRTMVAYLQKSQTESGFMSADQVLGYTNACVRTADIVEGRLNLLKDNFDTYVHILNALVEIVASGAKAVHQHVGAILSTTEATKRRLTNDTTTLAVESHVYFSDQATHLDEERKLVAETLAELNRRIKTGVVRRNFVSPILSSEAECTRQQLTSLKAQLEVISQRRAEVWFVIERLRKEFKQDIPFPPNPDVWKQQNGCYWLLPTVGLAIESPTASRLIDMPTLPVPSRQQTAIIETVE